MPFNGKKHNIDIDAAVAIVNFMKQM